MPPLESVRLLIIADDPLARAGLATMLAEWEMVTVVGQTPADEALLANVDVYRPDVVLWDLGWDADTIPAEFNDMAYPVLALLPHEELAVDAWAAGARGLLLRDADGETLQTALEAVGEGLLVLDPALEAALRPTARADELPPAEELTPREREVLHLLAEGLSNRAIGQELGISEHTVKFHVNAIMTKLDAQSRTEAVVRATRLGLILL